MPVGDLLLRERQPLGMRPWIPEGGVERLERDPGVADDRLRAMLVGVPAGRVDRHEPDVGILEQRPGAGREVLQPGPDGQHDIGPRRRRHWRPVDPVTPIGPA